MDFKNRRAVGGLISLIGIIIVFGIASVAFLELSSSQARLVNTSIFSSQRISDQNNEQFNFTSILDGTTKYDIQVENIGSNPSTVHSFLIDRNKSLIGKGELDVSILPGETVSMSTVLSSGTTIPIDDNIIFSTLSGKKCVIPADVVFRIC